MGSTIFVVVMIVFGVVSMVQKAREAKEAQRRLNDRQSQREGGNRPALDEIIPTAQPKGPQRSQPSGEGAQTPQELLEQMFGVKIERAGQETVDEEEGEWQAVPPRLRRELPQGHRPPATVQQRQTQEMAAQRQRQRTQQVSARPERQRPARSPAELVSGQGHRQRSREMETKRKKAEAERSKREEAKQRRRREEHARKQRTATQQRTPATRRTRRRGRLFGDLDDVRRAIVAAEVINRPKAFEDFDAPN